MTTILRLMGLFAALAIPGVLGCGKEEGQKEPAPAQPAAEGEKKKEAPVVEEKTFPLLSDEELRKQKSFQDLKEIEAAPDQVYRINLADLRDLKEFPKAVLACKRVQELDLHWRPIGSIPADIGTLRNLQKLTLNGCGLESLPAEMGKLENLVEVDVSGNKLKSLPDGAGNWKKAKIVSLGGNQLESLPAGLLNLPALETLWVMDNQLRSLPAVGDCPNLANFRFYNNPLRKLPEGFAKLKKLYAVEFTNMKDLDFTHAFAEVAKLPDVKTFDIGNLRGSEGSGWAKLSPKAAPIDVPESLKEMKALETLHARYNTFTKEGLVKLIDLLAGLPKLRHLDLGLCQIDEVPGAIEKLVNLDYLSAWMAPIKSLPPEIAKLPNLRQICLADCESLESVASLEGLAKLEQLELGTKTKVSKAGIDKLKEKFPKLTIR